MIQSQHCLPSEFCKTCKLGRALEPEAVGDDMACPLTDRSNKNDPKPTSSEFSNACKLGAALVLAGTSLILKNYI